MLEPSTHCPGIFPLEAAFLQLLSFELDYPLPTIYLPCPSATLLPFGPCAAVYLQLDDIIGAQAIEGGTFAVHTLLPGKDNKRVLKSAAFTCDTRAEAAEWVKVLRNTLAGVPVGGTIASYLSLTAHVRHRLQISPHPSALSQLAPLMWPPRHAPMRCLWDVSRTEEVKRRRLLVIINPFSGTKKAVDLYEKKVAPLFRLADLQVELRTTEAAGHAMEMARTLDLTAYDAVTTVSGDGLFQEVGHSRIPLCTPASRFMRGDCPTIRTIPRVPRCSICLARNAKPASTCSLWLCQGAFPSPYTLPPSCCSCGA